MKLSLLILLFLAPFSAYATDLDLNVDGGRIEDCELVELGSRASITGTILVKKANTDNKWASMTGIVLIEDAKPYRIFRFSLASISNSKRLEARYEYFHGEERLFAESLAKVDIGAELPYSISWDERGTIQLSVAGLPKHLLNATIKPSRAFVVISGANAKFSTSGAEHIDCSQAIFPEAE